MGKGHLFIIIKKKLKMTIAKPAASPQHHEDVAPPTDRASCLAWSFYPFFLSFFRQFKSIIHP